jgi:tetratricopeptide (TPR) repeat protein
MEDGQPTARPLCFVLMPFGRKRDAVGTEIDFDAVYAEVIAPAISGAGLDPLRADEERDGGFIHKLMFERLLLCQYAVADLTLANANVFYELGIRHAVRPFSTLLVYSPGAQRLPFDVAPLRAMPYAVDAAGHVRDADDVREGIRTRLENARDSATDSPLITLLEGYEPPQLSRLKTDVFRDRVRYAEGVKADLRQARRDGPDAVRAVRDRLGNLRDAEAGVLVDLLLSLRDVGAWEDINELVERMPRAIAATVLVQEQYGMALNRAGRTDDAVFVLQQVLDRAGPSSETFGLLGRVYKDQWRKAVEAGNSARAEGYLDRAIETYRQGFMADWRDAFPGINLATLLRLRNADDPELAEILPVVAYANKRRSGSADYWDHATALELAYLQGDHLSARAALTHALTGDDVEPWKRDTTANNLRLHLAYGNVSGEDRAMLLEFIAALT